MAHVIMSQLILIRGLIVLACYRLSPTHYIHPFVHPIVVDRLQAALFSPCTETIPLSVGHSINGGTSDQEDKDRDAAYLAPISLTSCDSLMLLHGTSSENESALMLHELLQQVLQALSSGMLTPSQVTQLSFLVKDILAELPAESIRTGPETSRDGELDEDFGFSQLQPKGMSSSASGLAEEVVLQTIDYIKKQLLETRVQHPKLDLPWVDSSTTPALVEFIVRRVVNSAFKRLNRHETTTAPVGQRPVLATPSQAGHPALARIASSTSDFIQGVVDCVTNEIASELSATGLPGPMQLSETAILVKATVSRALHDLDNSRSIQNVSWEAAQPPSPATSSASDTTKLVKSTIGRVLQKMEDEGVVPMKSASSIFADGLTAATLKQCLQEVRTGAVSPHIMRKLTISIIKAHRNISNRSVKAALAPEQTQSLSQLPMKPSSTSSVLMAALVRETLERIKSDLHTVAITPQEALTFAHDLGFPTSNELFTSTTDQKSSTTSLAEKSMVQTLQDILDQSQASTTRKDSLLGKSLPKLMRQK